MQTQHTCNNCKYGEWYQKGYDITMMDEECGGCTESHEKWESNVYQTQKVCEYCPNNPNNGGSGVCHCILGSPVIY